MSQERVSVYPQLPDGTVVTGEKSPTVALIIGFIIPGSGVVYGYRVWLGIGIFLISVLLIPVFVGFVLWIYGILLGNDLCRKK